MGDLSWEALAGQKQLPEELTEEEAFEEVFKKESHVWLQKWLAGLSKRDRQVIILRFGLEDGVPKTLAETGEALGISRERVRQIESYVLRKPVRLRRSKEIREYLD